MEAAGGGQAAPAGDGVTAVQAECIRGAVAAQFENGQLIKETNLTEPASLTPPQK